MDHLQSFIADCDRRTEVAKKRLAETQEEISAEVAAKVRFSVIFHLLILTLDACNDQSWVGRAGARSLLLLPGLMC